MPGDEKTSPLRKIRQMGKRRYRIQSRDNTRGMGKGLFLTRYAIAMASSIALLSMEAFTLAVPCPLSFPCVYPRRT